MTKISDFYGFIILQAHHNKLALQSEDFVNAVMAQATKEKNVVFSKL